MKSSLRGCAQVASVLALAISATSVFASTSETWDGSSNSWSAAAHWNPAVVPNNGTPAGTTYAVSLPSGQINLDINATIDSLTLTGGTLNDNLGNSLTVLGATSITNGVVQFGTQTAAGAQGTFGSVDNFGGFTTGYFTGGNNTVSTSGAFINEANANTFIDAPGDIANFHTLTNFGRLLIATGAAVNITSGGNGFTDVPQNSLLQVGGGFNVINGGTPSSALGHLATIEGDLQMANQNVADTSGITVSSTGGLELTGNQVFSAPSISNAGAVNLGYFVGGNNTLTIAGAFNNAATGVLRLANTADTVNVGSLTNNGVIQVNATETLNVTGGGSGVTDVVQGSTYSIGGAFNVINGNVTSSAFAHTASIEGDLRLGSTSAIVDASNISISATGGLELIGNQTFSTPNITNAGAVNLGYFVAGNNTLNISGTFTNTPTGVLRLANVGDVVNVGALVNPGYIGTSAGEVLNITGGGNGITDAVQGSTFAMAGPFNVINGNVTSSAFAHLASIEGDVRIANGNVPDVAAISIANTGGLELVGNQTFSTPGITNAGAVNLGYFATGNNTLTVSGTFTNTASGVLRLASSGDVVNVGSLVNQGFVGTVAGETLNITGGGNGITDVVQGATFSLGSPFNVINGNVTSSALGHLASVEGDLRLSVGAAISDASGVTISNTGAFELVGNQTFSTPAITNAGAVNLGYFATGNNTLTVSGTFTNAPTGILRLAATGDVVNVGALVNQGYIGVSSGETLNITGGGAGVTDVVAGSTIQLAGAFNVINGGVPSGALASLSSIEGALQLLNGQTFSLGNVSIASTGQFFLGNGTTLIAGNITNSGLLASSYFSATGNSFTITGTVVNNPGATFNLALGDTVAVGNITNNGVTNIRIPALTLNSLDGTAGNAVLFVYAAQLTINNTTTGSSNYAGVILDDNTNGSFINNTPLTLQAFNVGNVTANATLKIGATSRARALSIKGTTGAWLAGLDLANNKLIIEPSASRATAISTLQDQVKSGDTSSTGIYSSVPLPPRQAIAVLDNAIVHKGYFGGVSVDANAILVGPEVIGDANADGRVDLTDLATVLNNFNKLTANWTDGNFDRSDRIDAADINDVLNNFGVINPNNDPAAPSAAFPSVPAPEPASLGLFALAAPALLKRRRSAAIL